MKQVLLIEDNPDDVLFIQRAFRALEGQHTLQVAHDGEQALRALSGDPMPDLVLLDLKLPRLSGLEVLGWLRAQPTLALLPVVVLTASNEPQDVREAYRMGANSYLAKPVRPSSLRDMVAALGLYWLQFNITPPGR
ncbi:response regulator [Deinococcus sonorensis]|uniref:Response regulator n=2 Tax=Deinococcus sonorensis TaxID=309891 RepID=A0AAU7U6I8_9DEIO